MSDPIILDCEEQVSQLIAENERLTLDLEFKVRESERINVAWCQLQDERDQAQERIRLLEMDQESLLHVRKRVTEIADERDLAQAEVRALKAEYEEEIKHLSHMLYKQSPAGEKAAKCPFDECKDPGESCYDTLECNSRFVREIERLRGIEAEVTRLRWWLERVTQVEGVDDAGSGVWMCALRARAGLDGKPIKDDTALAEQPAPTDESICGRCHQPMSVCSPAEQPS